ncbi:M48 family metalloprotease, partial [Candidatus Bathyarchaeota archaeon]|nr:M48 family metalloprotease [Candidatus Bathyarchaeota archaeon]
MGRFVFGVIIPHTILIGLSIRLAAKPQFDVMEVNETRVRMIAAVLLGTFGLIAHCIMCCRFALFNPNAAPLIIATLSLAAPLCGLVYWSSATATIRRRSKSLQTYSGELYREIRDIVDTATAQLGLKHNVQLRTWHTPNTPPCTLRALFRRPFLILPPNLSDILGRLSKVTGIERQILFRFIVLHELSHLKNGDALFMPWARAFLETAKYFVPCLLISDIVVFAVYLESFKATLLGVSLVSISFGIPALVYLYVARHREHLADSRALLLIPNRHAEALARPCVTVRGKPLSAVELLFTYFTEAPTCDTANRPRRWLAGYIGRLVLEVFRWRLGNFKAQQHSKTSRLEWNTHPKTEERLKVLRDRVFLQARRPYLSVSASIWVGVSSILLFLMFSVPAFAIVEVIEKTWLGSGPMELTKFVLLSWAFLAAVGYVVSMFLIPCRCMLAPLSSSAKDVLVTVSRFLLVAVSWVIVFALGYLPSSASFVRVAPSLIALSLWPLGIFLVVLWVVLRTNTLNAAIRVELRRSTYIVALEVLSYIAFVVLLGMSQLVTIGPLVIAILLAVLMG